MTPLLFAQSFTPSTTAVAGNVFLTAVVGLLPLVVFFVLFFIDVFVVLVKVVDVVVFVFVVFEIFFVKVIVVVFISVDDVQGKLNTKGSEQGVVVGEEGVSETVFSGNYRWREFVTGGGGFKVLL